MNERKQLITPMMTDEEAQRIAHRTIMAVEAIGLVGLICLFVVAWAIVPA